MRVFKPIFLIALLFIMQGCSTNSSKNSTVASESYSISENKNVETESLTEEEAEKYLLIGQNLLGKNITNIKDYEILTAPFSLDSDTVNSYFACELKVPGYPLIERVYVRVLESTSLIEGVSVIFSISFDSNYFRNYIKSNGYSIREYSIDNGNKEVYNYIFKANDKEVVYLNNDVQYMF